MGILKGSPAKSTSGSAQKWAQPYASAGAQDVLDVFNAQQPNLSAVQGNVNSQMANLQSQGQTLAPTAAQASGTQGSVMASGAPFGQTAQAANGYYGGLIAGNQLSGNPYVRNMLQSLDQSVLNGVNSNFEGAGRYGSGAYVGTLANQLGQANANLLYQNYNDAANRQMQAAQAAGQMYLGNQGQQLTAAQQAQQAQAQNAQQQLTAAQLAAQIPYTGVNALGNSLGALFNGGTSSGGSPGLLGAIGAVGAGLASNPLLFS